MTTSAAGPLAAFRKILSLEQTGGCRNSAVIGGLDVYLARSAEAIALALGRPALAVSLRDAGYEAMTLELRRQWGRRWLATLDTVRTSAPSRPPTTTPPTPKAAPRPSPRPSTSTTTPAGAKPRPPAERVKRPEGAPMQAEATRLGLVSAPTLAPAQGEPVSAVLARGRAADSASVAKSQRAGPRPLRGSLDAPVTNLRGVSTGLAAKLKKLGVETVRGLLYLFPRRHEDFSRSVHVSELQPGLKQTVVATIWEAREKHFGQGGRMAATEATLGDETGNVRAVWFNQPYVARSLKTNSQVVISGEVELFNGVLQFQNPDWEVADGAGPMIHTGRLVPVYPLTKDLPARTVRRIAHAAVELYAPALRGYVPPSVEGPLSLMPLPEAVAQAHFPDSPAEAEDARRRLAFDELFLIQSAVLVRRRRWHDSLTGIPILPPADVVEGFLTSLPFTPTGAQRRAIGEVAADMARGTPPMSRLLQGEVGSGKTVVALAALLSAAGAGYQGAIMAPTEVLAEQHFSTVCRLLGGLGGMRQPDDTFMFQTKGIDRLLTVGMLTGSARKSVKRALQNRAADGMLDILVGTHALIQGEVELPRLGLAVVDEQHRFGVMQRAALREKGASAHVLVMSATPIPRTLALTLYGDLDISVLDELPPGRKPIKTRWVQPDLRDDAYEFVRAQVGRGRQAFVICPLIEESEAIESKAATEEHARLSTQVFPELRVELLHGRMGSKAKESVMRRFRDGETDILVATAVVEVGIDIPNASVMLIEAADRFGLAQLHQFRGRVGRGEHQSFCLLLSENPSPDAVERLQAMEQVLDGFKLAEIDLELRGPGDFFGVRQSGLPSLRMARLGDQALLVQAREAAQRIVAEDPDLTRPEHQPLAREVAKLLGDVVEEAS